MAEREKSRRSGAPSRPRGTSALSQAEGLPRGETRRPPLDATRRATAFASEALREVARRKETEEAARLEAEKRVREAAEGAVADEADRRRQAEASLAEIEELRQQTALDLERTRLSAAALAASSAQLEEERGRLMKEREALRREHDALAGGLADALGKGRADPRDCSRPRRHPSWQLVRPGKGGAQSRSTGHDSQFAGILLMLPGHNVRIEG